MLPQQIWSTGNDNGSWPASSNAATNRPQRPVAAPVDWAAEEARARRDLKRNAQTIDNTPRGTPSAKPPTWRLGRSPSSTPSDRTR